MIPVRLNLRNFMCYAEAHEALEFDGMQLACLAGANGNGKSALLDAITWALWGKARARTADELIHQAAGVTDMEVEFEFRLGGAQYRVIRKRSRRGGGRSMLELAVKDNEAVYRPLTGNNLSETERQIDQLLRMSYETFVNSSFIMQGKADSFTTKTPAERKQILAEILDLSYYDRLEALARQKASERNEQQNVLRQQIQDDDLELQRQPDLREQQQRLETELASLDERLRLSEARCEALRERLNRLKAAERELQDQQRRLEEARTRADRQRRLVATAEAALEQAGAVLAREAEIEKGYVELLERRGELEKLSITQAEHGRLTSEAAFLQRIIAQERGRLEGRVKQLAEQLDGGRSDASGLEQARREVEAARAEGAELERLETERASLADQLTKARERYAELKAHQEQHASHLVAARDRHQLLSDSPTCPVCRTALGPERHREVLEQYLHDEEEIADLGEKAGREKVDVLEHGTSLKHELTKLEKRLAQRSRNQERVAQAERALARAEEQEGRFELLEKESKELEAALSANDYAIAERQELVKLDRQILSLGYDPAIHKTAAEAATELAQFESLKQDLAESRRTVEREQQARNDAQGELAEWEAVAALADARRTELLVETAELADVESEWGIAETELRGQRLEQGRLREELGAVRQHLNTMDFTARRRDERRSELQKVLVERSIYQELTQAFGKKGLQAMLIETAIPEIEDEANRLLNLLTDGRMHVSFQTHRDARSGDSTIETLDIVIRDELGARAYELYSGGEAFRINFAIRIAISKLLARRAGARLQTLVVDEGFGSQDEQGRERLVEAIRAIRPEFEKILVITHLSDIKELFDTRIEVTKTPSGSVIQVL